MLLPIQSRILQWGSVGKEKSPSKYFYGTQSFSYFFRRGTSGRCTGSSGKKSDGGREKETLSISCFLCSCEDLSANLQEELTSSQIHPKSSLIRLPLPGRGSETILR